VGSEMSDKVIANLFYEGTSNDLGINVRTGRPARQENGLFLVPLEILIPMENLAILPRGEVHAGSFTMYVVVSNNDRDMSEVKTQQQAVHVPASEIGSLGGKHFTYAVDLQMEPGRGRISVGILDDVTNATGFRIQDILVRDLR
jgi:hypothetical protein